MPRTRAEKIFCVTTYLETKSFKTVSKYDNDLSLRQETQKKKKKWHDLEADIKTILKKH